MNCRLARDQVVLLETAANLCASWHKANDFFAVFSSFELESTCITKHLMTGPAGSSEFCFPLALPRETSRDSRKHLKLAVSLGASH